MSATYWSPRSALGFLAGALWSCLNLFAISHVVRSVLGSERPSKLKVVKLSLVKFPILYGTGFLLLRSRAFSPESLVAGFSLVLVVILLKIVGASVAERLAAGSRAIVYRNGGTSSNQ